MNVQLFYACLAVALTTVLACGNDGDGNTATAATDPDATTQPGQTTPPATEAPPDACDTPIEAYDDSTYLSDSGSDVEPDELSCDFEDACCWNNEVAPRDEKEFVVGNLDGVPSELIEQALGGADPPDGKFGVARQKGSAPGSEKEEAKFISCSIACTEEDVEVSLKHWASPGMTIEVCTQDARNDNSDLLNCQEVDAGSSPGPSTVTLPPGEFFRIVVVAKGFNNEGCNIAAIDDIEVKAEPCPAKTVAPVTAVTTAAGGEDPCDEVGCDFEPSSQCSYSNLQQSGGSNKFQPETERIGNRDTGVPRPPDGSTTYQGVVLEPQETAVLQSQEFTGPAQPGILKFKYYEATAGMRVKACVNDLNNCPFESNTDIKEGDRNWLDGQIPVDSNTKKILFVAENTDQNIGSVGIDDITLTRDNSDVCA